MNLIKSYEFFQPEKYKDNRIHIIGCGSVGSTIAENLARCGVTNMTLWDFDKVEEHNIANQMFTEKHIGKTKVEALEEILLDINPEIINDIQLKPNGWQGKRLAGYIFLCVDSIELRREIVEKHFNSPDVIAMFDVRTMLTGAQHYATDWSNHQTKSNFLESMNFSHEEAAEETPISACGTTLGIATTVRLISGMAVNNFIKYLKGEGLWNFVQIDGFHGTMMCI